jgi:hypothetical protein
MFKLSRILLGLTRTQILLASFRRFLGRGTRGDLSKLFPNTQSNDLADSLISTHSASIPEGLAAQTKSNGINRIQNIIRAVEALKTAAPLPLESYRKLWCVKVELFVGDESGMKGWMCRL